MIHICGIIKENKKIIVVGMDFYGYRQEYQGKTKP